MKCGLCERPLRHLDALCDCGLDPNAGWIMHNRYQLLGLIGQGGMGMIYRALDQHTQQRCAIKISRWNEALQKLRQMESAEAKAEERARIEREFKLLEKAASRSSHVVQVFDTFREDPMLGLYYPMEFLEGQPLSKLPEWGQAMSPREVVPLILQLCEGVGVAHGLGVVHRDLNPDNIFIVRTEKEPRFVKLIDFGIARDLYARKGIYNTGSDLAFGHLHYLAPEQVGYDPVTDEYQTATAARLDHRADIYSLGAIMFHMLTGVPPFDDGTIEGLALRNWRKPPHVARAIKESFLPHELQELILSCLQPTPNLRLPDILAFSDLLQSYMYSQRSEEAFSVLIEHASQSPDVPDAGIAQESLSQVSWEFPAVEGTWHLPAVDMPSTASGTELSVFSQEFNSLFGGEEEAPAGGLDFSEGKEDRTSHHAESSPSGILSSPPPSATFLNMSHSTTPPVPGSQATSSSVPGTKSAPPLMPSVKSTPPPVPGSRSTPPPMPSAKSTPPPVSGLQGSPPRIAEPKQTALAPLMADMPLVATSSLPTEVWNSLDNAPAFLDWDEEETAVPSSSPSTPPPVVTNPHQLNVEQFLEGVSDIVDTRHLPTLAKQNPYYQGPAQRSPHLEVLLSRDNLDVASGLVAAKLESSVPDSSHWLASEILVDMEVEEEIVSSSPSLSSGASWNSPSGSRHPVVSSVSGTNHSTLSIPGANGSSVHTPLPSTKISSPPSNPAVNSATHAPFFAPGAEPSPTSLPIQPRWWVWVLGAVILLVVGYVVYRFVF